MPNFESANVSPLNIKIVRIVVFFQSMATLVELALIAFCVISSYVVPVTTNDSVLVILTVVRYGD